MEQREPWLEILKLMVEEGSITINRSYKPEDVDLLREVILICYMDGSNAAKAFEAYIRYLLESGQVHVALLAAKVTVKMP